MNITSAKYIADIRTGENSCINIIVEENGDKIEMSVPLEPDNTDYAEIQRQVKAKTLTIKDAD